MSPYLYLHSICAASFSTETAFLVNITIYLYVLLHALHMHTTSASSSYSTLLLRGTLP